MKKDGSSSAGNGKALEYLVSKAILESGIAVADPMTVLKQLRDESSMFRAGSMSRRSLVLGAMAIVNWVRSMMDDKGALILSRPDDALGETGDPSDVILVSERQTIRLSLKLRNDAVKHNRPSNLSGQLGFGRGSDLDQVWKKNYALAIKDTFQGFDSSSPVKASDIDSQSLYHRVNAASSAFLNETCALHKTAAAHLYAFLLGPPDLKIAYVENKQIRICNWETNRLVTGLEANALGDYLVVEFSNGHVFRWRLHTAAEEMSATSPSLKWDVRSDTNPNLLERKIFN